MDYWDGDVHAANYKNPRVVNYPPMPLNKKGYLSAPFPYIILKYSIRA